MISSGERDEKSPKNVSSIERCLAKEQLAKETGNKQKSGKLGMWGHEMQRDYLKKEELYIVYIYTKTDSRRNRKPI